MRVIDERADLYAPVLQNAGCADVEVRQLDWRTAFGLPGHHMTLVSASKPAAGLCRGELVPRWSARPRDRIKLPDVAGRPFAHKKLSSILTEFLA
jgi:hypothetical protein